MNLKRPLMLGAFSAKGSENSAHITLGRKKDPFYIKKYKGSLTLIQKSQLGIRGVLRKRSMPFTCIIV